MDKKSFWRNTLTQLKGKVKKKDFVGFDVETFGDSNEFMSGGFYYYKNGVECFEYFLDREKMLEFILRYEFRNKFVVASNLGFDLSVLFWGTKYWNNIKLVTRGSDILMASYKLSNNNGRICFIDTFNYVRFSVEKLGSIIGIDKMEKPSYLGERKPINDLEWFELKMYNKRDCKISCDFMYFLQKGINEAGGNIKVTIASTSLDVWRRNHLNRHITKESFILGDPLIKDFIFSGYYGGRTEVFKRGVFENVNYYDINSLYPSVMRKAFPLPSSIRNVNRVDIDYILNYEGVSECEVVCPSNLRYPLLPVKHKGKLIFPSGNFVGVWNNVELRKALSLGYKVKPIKQVIYTEKFYPFKSYVDTFYAMRLKEQEKGSPMELVYKLLLNSLYGKFAQKERQNISIKFLVDMSDKEYIKYLKDDSEEPSFYVKNGVLVDIKKSVFDGVFSLPILSSYTTSYARLKMYSYLEKYDVLYMDTDSVVISDEIMETSKVLGDMKLEDSLSSAFFVKPKFYMMNPLGSSDDIIKIKGVTRPSKDDFFNLINGGSVSRMKFSKIRQSIRSGISPNTKINVTKSCSVLDDKREWLSNNFLSGCFDDSKPLVLDCVGGVNIILDDMIRDFDVDVYDKSIRDVVRFFIRDNSWLRSKFKGRMSELKEEMMIVLDKGVGLDLIDWRSFGNDKPIGESVRDMIRGEF